MTRASIPIAPSFPKASLIVGLALALGSRDRLRRSLPARLSRPAHQDAGRGRRPPRPAGAGGRAAGRRARPGAPAQNADAQALARHDPNATGLLPPPLQPPLMRYATEEPSSLFADCSRHPPGDPARAADQARANRARDVGDRQRGQDHRSRSTWRCRSQRSASAPCWSTATCAIRKQHARCAPRARSGLLQVALGEEPIERAILVDRGSGLSVLPAPVNAYSHATSELMFSERIGIVFEPSAPALRADRSRLPAAASAGRWPRACRARRPDPAGARMGQDPARRRAGCGRAACAGSRPDPRHGAHARRHASAASLRLLQQLGLHQTLR